MELEIINKLFLELSQIITVETSNEVMLRKQLKIARDFIFCIAYCDENKITVQDIIRKCRNILIEIESGHFK